MEADTFVEMGLCSADPEGEAGLNDASAIGAGAHDADGALAHGSRAAPVEDAPPPQPVIDIDSSPEKCKREPCI